MEGLEEDELLSDVETEVGEEEPHGTQQNDSLGKDDGHEMYVNMSKDKGRGERNMEQGDVRSDTGGSEVDSSAQRVSEMYVEEESGKEGDDEPRISSVDKVEQPAMTLEECIEYEENLVSNQVLYASMSDQMMEKDGESSQRALEDAAARIISKFDAIEMSFTEMGVEAGNEKRNESGASIGKRLVARCFLNPEFDFSVNKAKGSDEAVPTIEQRQNEDFASKAWSHGVPDVVCYYKSVVAVGDSVGLIHVLHPGKLPRCISSRYLCDFFQ